MTYTKVGAYMPKTTGGEKTSHYYIRLPEGTIAEVDGYVKESGCTRLTS